MHNPFHSSLYVKLTIEYGLTDHEIMRHMPPLQGDIARAIGLSSALVFIEKFCGRMAYIPDSVRTDNDLVRFLGAAHAEKIIEIVGGSRKVTLGNPFNSRFFLKQRVAKALLNGCSLNEVTTNMGVGRSLVKEVRKTLGLPKIMVPDNRKAVAIAMLHEGKSIEEIIEVTAFTKGTICRWRKEAGISGRSESPQKSMAVSMLRMGASTLAVHIKTGVARDTINSWRRQMIAKQEREGGAA